MLEVRMTLNGVANTRRYSALAFLARSMQQNTAVVLVGKSMYLFNVNLITQIVQRDK